MWRKPDDHGLEFATPQLDQAIAALATRQHGAISATQLASLGVSQRAVSHRVRAGRLHRLHNGVYAVGHTVLGAHGRYMAAVLACGRGAALSHASAAALWELRASSATHVDVIVPSITGRKRPGLRIHRARSLGPEEVTTHRGIPVTTPARTLLDLAATLPRRQLERALDQAENQELTDVRALEALARDHSGHHGAGNLRRALREHRPGSTLTRSELEEAFLALCRTHGLPEPRVNTTVAGFQPNHQLIVETDGWRCHRTRQAFERDRHRDVTLTRAGYRTLRVTHRHLHEDPGGIAATIGAALADRRSA